MGELAGWGARGVQMRGVLVYTVVVVDDDTTSGHWARSFGSLAQLGTGQPGQSGTQAAAVSTCLCDVACQPSPSCARRPPGTPPPQADGRRRRLLCGPHPPLAPPPPLELQDSVVVVSPSPLPKPLDTRARLVMQVGLGVAMVVCGGVLVVMWYVVPTPTCTANACAAPTGCSVLCWHAVHAPACRLLKVAAWAGRWAGGRGQAGHGVGRPDMETHLPCGQ